MESKSRPEIGRMTRRAFMKGCGIGACAPAAAALMSAAAPGSARAQTAQRGLLGQKRSPWFSPLSDGALRCTLCPRRCRVPEGKRGYCRVRGNRGGRGYTLVYGNPAIVQVDPIERKPFYHVLPASQSLSVATAGCNVACKFCEVWDMALVAPEDVHAYEMPPELIVEHALGGGAGSVSFTYGEPVVFFEYMLDTAAGAKESGLLSLLHTNGYINREPLEKLCEVIDGANIDLKAFDDDFYRDIVGGGLEPVLETLRILRKAGRHIEITNLVIPGLNDDVEDIRRMCMWIKEELGPGTPLHFNRFYPLYRLANLPPTPVSSLDAARETAMEAGLHYVYIGNVMGHEGQHTLCPGCGTELIHRVGFMIDPPRIEGGRCPDCDHSVPGIWGRG